MRIAYLFLLFFFVACTSTAPSPADVQADRARWTAVRDVSIDGQIDATESPLLAQLLLDWDKKLTADEAAAGRQRDAKSIAEELARVYGAAVLTVALSEVAPKIEQQAPEAFRLVDKNSDHLISMDELLAVDPTSPIFALVVTTTAAQLIQRRR